tara:strand:- start:319 stop:1086 length:768 start_codon:yes stop_codon:yes gene_type:complete
MTTEYKSYNKFYNKNYFTNFKDISYNAAKVVLNDLYKIYKFKSVVDFGCGFGGWIRAAWEINNDIKVTGIDGDYIKDILDFDKGEIIYKNLEENVNIKKHDLAISVETAEHLSPGRANTFVKDLCNSSDVIFFSAAVDGHGGANHLNEQTQSYWINIFNKNGFDPFIFLDRKKYWFHETFDKCPYYISGSFLYIKRDTDQYELFKKFKVQEDFVPDIVHPYILQWRKDENFGVKKNFDRLLASLKKFLRRKFFKA